MKMVNRFVRAALLTIVLAAASSAQGHDSGPEFIESFDTTLDIHEDGAMAVTHVIDVHPHGNEIRRGLFFELPDDVGPLSGFVATLGDDPIDLKFDDGAVVVAAAEPLAIQETHRFVLRYRAESPWWQTSSGAARLSWTPVTDQFELAWRDAELRIEWQEAEEPPQWPVGGMVDGNAWTRSLRGPVYGEQADGTVGRVELQAKASSIGPQALRSYGTDWPWRVSLAVGLMGLIGFLHTAWRTVGRDPDPGMVSARDTAPDGLSPAATRFVDHMGFDETTFATALVSLRTRRAIELTVEDENERLLLEKRRDSSVELPPGERAMLQALFDGETRVELAPGDRRAMHAMSALKKKLGEEHRGRHFVANAVQRAWGLALGLMLVGLAIVAIVVQARDALTPDPWVIGLGVVSVVTGIVAPLVYFELFKAPTRAGAEAKRQIAGLKHYFEEDRSPVTEARHFLALLPYAVALDREAAWRDRFEGEDESGLDAESAEVLAWYREFHRRYEQIGAIVPVIAGMSATSAANGAVGASGASAGGV